MRLGTTIAGAAALLVLGFLGFRILDLEQKVALLTAQLGTPADAPTAQSTSPQSPDAPTAQPLAKGYAQRLTTLERRVDELAAASNARRTTDNNQGQDTLGREAAILSVVERENSRIRDVQLEWHRTRWLELRAQQLTAFASDVKLVPAQTAALNEALQREVDGLVKLLKQPELASDPDQAANGLQAVLTETDERARRVLTSEQQQRWTQARLLERKAYWPWLPQGTMGN